MTIANSGRLIAHYDLMSRLWDTDDAETCDAIERERQALPPITPDEYRLLFVLVRSKKPGEFAVLGGGSDFDAKLKAMADLLSIAWFPAD